MSKKKAVLDNRVKEAKKILGFSQGMRQNFLDFLLYKFLYYKLYYYSVFLKILTISHDVGLDSGTKNIM